MSTVEWMSRATFKRSPDGVGTELVGAMWIHDCCACSLHVVDFSTMSESEDRLNRVEKIERSPYLLYADLIEVLHVIITIISIVAMFFIFLYEPLKLYSAIWLASLCTIERICGCCPLRVKEYDWRKKAGEKVEEKKFIPRFFKKHLNLDIPDWLAQLWLGLYFVISATVLVMHIFR